MYSHFPSPLAFQKKVPFSQEMISFVKASRRKAKKIFKRQDPRFLVIVGPCSIHDIKSTLAYAKKLKNLIQEISDQFYVIMRFYVEKPRTLLGWKGLINDPHLDFSHDLEEGILQTRFLLSELAHLGIPLATEFLDPLYIPYFQEGITWSFIGARTVCSQIHRQVASHLHMPVGFKNFIDGDIDLAIESIFAARSSHTFLGLTTHGKLKKIESAGNPYTHLVLRGSKYKTNFDALSVKDVESRFFHYKIKAPILIDCSHGNSGKEATNQKIVFRNVLKQIQEGSSSLLGVMIESHLHGQLSKTDPCLDWVSTEELLWESSKELSSSIVMRSAQS